MTEEAMGLSKTLSKKLTVLLHDLGAPPAPLPTKAVCDLYDQVKNSALALLSIQSAIQKREKEIAALRGGVQEGLFLPHSALVLPFPTDTSRPITGTAQPVYTSATSLVHFADAQSASGMPPLPAPPAPANPPKKVSFWINTEY